MMIALAFSAHKLLVSFLLAAFLVAQGSLLFHHADFEAHAPGEECEYCLHISHLKHPHAPSSGELFSSSTINTVLPGIEFTTVIQHHHIATLARGPPPLSHLN